MVTTKREILGGYIAHENIPFTLNFATKAKGTFISVTDEEVAMDYNPKLQMNNSAFSINMGSTCNRSSGTTTNLLGGTDPDDDNMQDD